MSNFFTVSNRDLSGLTRSEVRCRKHSCKQRDRISLFARMNSSGATRALSRKKHSHFPLLRLHAVFGSFQDAHSQVPSVAIVPRSATQRCIYDAPCEEGASGASDNCIPDNHRKEEHRKVLQLCSPKFCLVEKCLHATPALYIRT